MHDIRDIGIGVYTTIIPPSFIKHRDASVIRTEKNSGPWDYSKGQNYYRRWDCEAPEYSLDSIGHKPSGQNIIPYDTLHPIMGKCDFKYYAKNGASIAKYPRGQIAAGNVDTIVLWKWVKWIPDPYRSLAEGEEREFEILGNVKASEVLVNLDENYRFKLNPGNL
jgi:hypothetical protein